jgi:hypothetical protein
MNYFDLKFDARELSGDVLWFPGLKQAELEAQGTAEEIMSSSAMSTSASRGSLSFRIQSQCPL